MNRSSIFRLCGVLFSGLYQSRTGWLKRSKQVVGKPVFGATCVSPKAFDSMWRPGAVVKCDGLFQRWCQARCSSSSSSSSSASLEMKVSHGVVRFDVGKPSENVSSHVDGRRAIKKAKMTRKAKLNELRFYRLKAKKKMNSPNPEVRIRYKLDKAKRKEEWLIEKLRKYDAPKAPAEVHDPESLTEEEKHYLKRTGEKKKHYVPVGKRGVFGGVVLNMHLHWKRHETVKVSCKPCRPGQIQEYSDELARLSKGIVIDIKPNNTILFYRGKNYVRPEVMSPTDTLSKAKALEKYQYEQSLEHTSQFIEKLEKELEEYRSHVAKYRTQKEHSPRERVLESADNGKAAVNDSKPKATNSKSNTGSCCLLRVSLQCAMCPRPPPPEKE